MGIIVFNTRPGGSSSVSGLTTANNGLTVNPAGNVQLGGVLVSDTQIDLTDKSIQFFAVNAGITTDYTIATNSIIREITDSGGNGDNTSVTQDVTSVVTIGTNGVSTNSASVSVVSNDGADEVSVVLNVQTTVGLTAFIMGDSLAGLNVSDTISSVGLIGLEDYQAFAVDHDLVYAQVSTVKALLGSNTVTPSIVPGVEVLGATSTQAVLTLPTPVSGNPIYRLNGQLHVNTVTVGTVKLSVAYTDIASAPQTFDLVPLLSAIGDTATPPMVFKAKQGTNIVVTATVTGTINYSAAVFAELLF